MAQIIKRGFIASFNPATYTCSIYLLEAQTVTLDNVPVALHVDNTSMLTGAYCAVLFFDEHNLNDAAVIATYASPTSGSIPAYKPGRVAFIPKYKIYDASLPVGATTVTAAGVSNIPGAANAVLCNIAYICSSSASATLSIGPTGAPTCTMNVQATNKEIDMSCTVPLSGGQFVLNASIASYATVYIYGYIM
ncbi:hypothetical protein KSD_62650 [Ktedonobacter sp. SOSP1-85]|uniref:hypothetical protein n=1 Tax=Ktedonobacter sp. SOSP1-85 TaxID=2778367 RepID=UPI00191672CD|nr:hypothetical protein [Ktedonobacter sp. SOSP1-85]GHO78494.1 hypothetical protein KSD_62650 [Ktedonobacter sp. SOSP1-85]